MNDHPEDAVIPREGLILTRILAVILFSFTIVIGPATVLAGSAKLLGGDWRAIGIVAGGGGVAWTLGWLGMRLWSGRSIPRWFISAFFVTIFSLPFAISLAKGSWSDFEDNLTTLGPWALIYALCIHPYRMTKPRKPEGFDDLA